jgi:hypothetical protein
MDHVNTVMDIKKETWTAVSGVLTDFKKQRRIEDYL